MIAATATPPPMPKIKVVMTTMTSEKSIFKKLTPGMIGNSNFITTKAMAPIMA